MKPATPEEILKDAEEALHDVLTTGGVVRVRHGDKWTEYSPTNIAELKAYVARLRGSAVTIVRLSTSKGL